MLLEWKLVILLAMHSFGQGLFATQENALQQVMIVFETPRARDFGSYREKLQVWAPTTAIPREPQAIENHQVGYNYINEKIRKPEKFIRFTELSNNFYTGSILLGANLCY